MLAQLAITILYDVVDKGIAGVLILTGLNLNTYVRMMHDQR